MLFAPFQFEDPQGIHFKLAQSTSIRDYQAQFEALSNLAMDLPHNFLISFLISGLKPHLYREVQTLQPINLLQAIDPANI